MNKTLLLVTCGLLGCGVGEEKTAPVNSSTQELSDDNGMSANGFSANGMSANGFSANGFSANGFSANGLRTVLANGSDIAAGTPDPAFVAWFNSNPSLNASWMKYFIKCTQAAGDAVTYGGYTWYGALGLAPNWRLGGSSITVADQEAVSACLMAHVNALGNSVRVSMRSPSPAIFTGSAEMSAYPQGEGAFFGNLFGPARLAYACSRQISKPLSCSSVPGTTIQYGEISEYNPSGGTGRSCASLTGGCGLYYVGTCNLICGSFPSGGVPSCTYGGRAFTHVMTTFQPAPTTADICDTFRFKFQ